MVPMHEFNLQPPWLHAVAEHELLAVDADTLTANTHLSEVHHRSYWIKVSSFQALLCAMAASSGDARAELRATPLCKFLMQSIPLADAQRVFDLMTGEMEPLVLEVEPAAELEVVVCYHDLVDRECKVALFRAAERGLARVHQAREVLAGSIALYELGLADDGGMSAAEQQQQEAAKPEQLAAADRLLARREARWRELATRLTFLGYAPPPPAAADSSLGAAAMAVATPTDLI